MQNAKELTKILVSMESSNPGTYENALADYLEAQLMAVLPAFGNVIRKNYADRNADHFGQKRIRPVIMAVLPGANIEKELVFICHMDTVPIGESWSVDPLYGAGILAKSEKAGIEDSVGAHKNGIGADLKNKHRNADGTASPESRIYGRGSCDMKSGLACALTAFSEACALAKANGAFQNTLKLILTSDEEGDMQGVEHVIDWGWVKNTSYVMDTEPTNKEVQTAHKGRFWYEWICNGRVAHASKPNEGANAILGMAYAMVQADTLFKELRQDGFCGTSSLTFGKISGGTQKYQVPGQCKVSVDMRLVPPYDERVGERLLKEASKAAMEMVRGVHFEVSKKGSRPAVSHNPDSQLLKLLCETIREVTGEMPDIAVFPGYTDTAVIASATGCRETLSYGPGDLALAHQPDEYVDISEIERCEKVYGMLMKKFLCEGTECIGESPAPFA